MMEKIPDKFTRLCTLIEIRVKLDEAERLAKEARVLAERYKQMEKEEKKPDG